MTDVVLRYITRDGRPGMSWACRLVIVVTPDLRWTLKDEAVLAERERERTFSSGLVAAIREEADAVVRVIESRGSPFDEGSERWRPDPSWPLPRLHQRWDHEPPALRERRLWAYPRADDRGASEPG